MGGGISAQSWHHASSTEQRQQAGMNKHRRPRAVNAGPGYITVKLRSLSNIWTNQVIHVIV